MTIPRRLALIALAAVAFVSSSCSHSSHGEDAAFLRERLVSNPSRIAFLASDRARAGLGGEIRFGGPLGRSALYLKFPTAWRTRGIPRRAFLTLSPREGATNGDETLTVEAWRIAADWQAARLQHWRDKPSLAPPYARRKLSPGPARELRIDVTELVRFAAENPERDFGMAVIASGSDGPGATFSTGFAGGLAPRLELYLR